MSLSKFRFIIIGVSVMAATFLLVYILETNTLAAIDVSPAEIVTLKNSYNFMRGIGIFIGSILIVIGFACKRKKNKS